MREFVRQDDLLPLLHDTLGSNVKISSLSQGLLNQNLLVTVTTPNPSLKRRGDRVLKSKFVLKVYRPEMPREKVDEMHRLMGHVSRRGIPVSLPIATYSLPSSPLRFKEGVGGGYRPVGALYPFVEGEHPARYKNKSVSVHTMGEMLGAIDHALDSYRPSTPKPTSLDVANWDPAAFAKELVDIRASLRGKPKRVRDDVERTVAAYEFVLPQGNWDKRRFTKLPVRVCHNDYHIKNVLMRDGKIVAVLDWEKAGWDWRGYEVFRSVMFNCRGSNRGLDWDLIESYLRGYKRFARLNRLERELAFDCGFNKAFFSLWAIKQYITGNTQTRENMLRRGRALPSLFKRRDEFRERIERLLRPSSSQ